MSESHPRLAIIADDLTGGLDTGVAFADRGWRTMLCVGPPSQGDAPVGWLRDRACEAIVWDTETREAEEKTARRVVQAVLGDPSVRAAPRLYKKIDSTLRGPWLAELQEVWKARASPTTVLCPAFPAVGRTLVEGEVRVHGRPLAEAGFEGSGRLRELLLERWCGHVVSLSAPQLREAPLFDPAQNPCLLLADAETDADLDLLVERLHQLDLDHLLCGAGGLAAAWARVLIPEPRPLPPLDPVAGPIWVLAGSQHAATRAQMETLAAIPGAHVEWFAAETADFAACLHRLPSSNSVGLALKLITDEIELKGQRQTITPSSLHLRRSRHPITPSAAAWAAEFIQAATAEARERGVAAFVATGGETAALLLRAMNAGTLVIDRELLPGIPLCYIADGSWTGTPLVTKAGGFGEPGALAQVTATLRTA